MTLSLRRFEGEEPAAQGRMDVPFASLGEGEMEEVRRAVKSCPSGSAARSGSAGAARGGRIDPHRTLRRSLQTGGVPFQPARARRGGATSRA